MKTKQVILTAVLLISTLITFGQKTAEEYFYSAYAKMEAKDYKGAIEEFTKSIELDSTRASTYINRALCRGKIGDTTREINDLRAAIAINPKDEKAGIAYGNMGIIKLNNEDYNAALVLFNKAIEINKESADLFINRAATRINLLDYQGANEDCDNAVKIDPNNYMAYYYKGVIGHSTNNNKQALKNLDKSIKLNTNDAEVYYERATVKYELNKFKSAMKDCEIVLQLDGDYLEVYDVKAAIQIETKDYAGCIESCNILIDNGFDDEYTYYYRAQANYELGNKDLGCKDLQKSIDKGLKEAKKMYKLHCR
jgi:serine/threonine-protein kinase